MGSAADARKVPRSISRDRSPGALSLLGLGWTGPVEISLGGRGPSSASGQSCLSARSSIGFHSAIPS